MSAISKVHPSVGYTTISVVQTVISQWPIIALIVVHIGLGVLMARFPVIARVHSLVIVAASLAVVLISKDEYVVLYLIGYIVGAEMLWRSTSTALLYEISKYLVGAYCLILLLRHKRQKSVVKSLAFYYFLALLPAVFAAHLQPNVHYEFTIPLIDDFFHFIGLDRQAIAFSLSGPLVLAVSTAYFCTVRLNRQQMIHLFTAILLPLVSVLSFALFSTITAANLYFGRSSNNITAGGSAPNQVSALLGLGAVICFWLLVLIPGALRLKLLIALLSALFMFQAALTFSRGGVWGALGAILVGIVLLFPKRRNVIPILFATGMIILLTSIVLLPTLDKVTQGAFSARFSSLDSTGRTDLANEEIQAFLAHPILGVGPVDISNYRSEESHTEYTRLLAEHGLLGVIALVILAFLCVQRLFRKTSRLHKALIMSTTAWALLYMTNAAMRLAAPGFMFGLGAILVLDTN